jgi:hypothetical protein
VAFLTIHLIVAVWPGSMVNGSIAKNRTIGACGGSLGITCISGGLAICAAGIGAGAVCETFARRSHPIKLHNKPTQTSKKDRGVAYDPIFPPLR